MLLYSFSGVTSYFDSKGNVKDFTKIRLSIISVLIGVGMLPSSPKLVKSGPPAVLSVLLDGRVVGALPSSEVEKVVAHLRRLKVSAASVVSFRFNSVLIMFPSTIHRRHL